MGTILTVEIKEVVSMSGGSSVESSVNPEVISLIQFLSSSIEITTEVVCTDIQLVAYDTVENPAFTIVEYVPIHHAIGTSIMVNAPPVQTVSLFEFYSSLCLSHLISVHNQKQNLLVNEYFPSVRR